MAAPNPAKSGQNSGRSRTAAGLAKKGRMPDLPEPEPKFGTSLVVS